jgi:hypothetical protein
VRDACWTGPARATRYWRRLAAECQTFWVCFFFFSSLPNEWTNERTNERTTAGGREHYHSVRP